MIVKEKTKDKITISFSGSVGKEGLARIKDYIEFLEKMVFPAGKRYRNLLSTNWQTR